MYISAEKTQLLPHMNAGKESTLIITVDYDYKWESLDFESMTVFNHVTQTSTDITQIMVDYFDDAIDAILNEIDWKTIAELAKPEKPVNEPYDHD